MRKLFFLSLGIFWIISVAGAPAVSVQSCMTCHPVMPGPVASVFPTLNGQSELYLLKQLYDFKQGRRDNAVMRELLVSTSDADLVQFADFYARKPAAQGMVAPAFLPLGERLYRGGGCVQGIPACAACHGVHGEGNNLAKFPALSGQYALYTLMQLRYFRGKHRCNDPQGMMTTIASRMSDAQMQAVAEYVSGLH